MKALIRKTGGKPSSSQLLSRFESGASALKTQRVGLYVSDLNSFRGNGATIPANIPKLWFDSIESVLVEKIQEC